MKITIIGTGYVGLVTGTCFAEMGNTVTCIDIDALKIENLKKGIIPIYEKGLQKMVAQNLEKKTLFFDTVLSTSLNTADLVFIAVGTPMGEDGSADLQYVLAVARQIGTEMQKDLIVVNKSTVPVGTSKLVQKEIERVLDERAVSFAVEVISNPEFLKEGVAVTDFMKPDRVIVGANSNEAFDLMYRLYKPFMEKNDRFIKMDTASSEMTKYAANAMLATKISFINEIANICEVVGADVNQVRRGIGSDTRIGFSFIYPGAGYGGSCFPKDVQALIKTAQDHHYAPRILQAVEQVNKHQKEILGEKINKYFDANLSSKNIAVWGLSFKPDTDDMRDAPSIPLIKYLLDKGAKVTVYDPEAMDIAKDFYFKNLTGITYAQDKYTALESADALVLVTEWKEFRSPDFDRINQSLINPVIFDGRNQYDAIDLAKKGFTYFQIGVRSAK
ncbi:MAG TPA: UDP-glucose/GDP-mannose dehydrogenase family protein [Saprospiraceae bacterium]|nr:UDP-glucose/GDP-mannose dehydrogenase family protein [Saprospiraceae bacterium]